MSQPTQNTQSAKIEAVVAMANNGTIGLNNTLPWRLKSDLQRFKRITMGHALLMGRKTFDSIGCPLPGRQTFVLSRNKDLVVPGCTVVTDLAQAISQLPAGKTLFVVGGAEVYRLLAGQFTAVHLTKVLCDVEGDAKLPTLDLAKLRCVDTCYTPADLDNEFPTTYSFYKRFD
jgi:dihydrofolate reductase